MTEPLHFCDARMSHVRCGQPARHPAPDGWLGSWICEHHCTELRDVFELLSPAAPPETVHRPRLGLALQLDLAAERETQDSYSIMLADAVLEHHSRPGVIGPER
ncbi:MAG: hypothetical protein OXG15_02515 [Gammaproteobacteria bacterium]|nr:hypothetical protein [Gammaproteobacteria bacterium]